MPVTTDEILHRAENSWPEEAQPLSPDLRDALITLLQLIECEDGLVIGRRRNMVDNLPMFLADFLMEVAVSITRDRTPHIVMPTDELRGSLVPALRSALDGACRQVEGEWQPISPQWLTRRVDDATSTLIRNSFIESNTRERAISSFLHAVGRGGA